MTAGLARNPEDFRKSSAEAYAHRVETTTYVWRFSEFFHPLRGLAAARAESFFVYSRLSCAPSLLERFCSDSKDTTVPDFNVRAF